MSQCNFFMSDTNWSSFCHIHYVSWLPSALKNSFSCIPKTLFFLNLIDINLYVVFHSWLTAAFNRGGGACGLWGVCEQPRSGGGARSTQTADGVPPGWLRAPPPGQRVHNTGASAAWGRRVRTAVEDPHTVVSHCNTFVDLHTRRHPSVSSFRNWRKRLLQNVIKKNHTSKKK